MPTFERPLFLKRAVQSVISQEYSDFILRIHDNGQDEETFNYAQEICAAYDRIQYFRHPQNIGGLANFQSLIDSVNTPFYLLISDDDFILPWHIRKAVELLERNQASLFCSSATITANTIDQYLQVRNQDWKESLYKPSEDIVKRVKVEHFSSTGTVYRYCVLERMRCFHLLGMDDVLSIILSGSFPFVVTPLPGAVFQVHEKRPRWHGIKELSISEILFSGSWDRKFVIDNAAPENIPILLGYLEETYCQLLRQKITHLLRVNSNEKYCLENSGLSKEATACWPKTIPDLLKIYLPISVIDTISAFNRSKSLKKIKLNPGFFDLNELSMGARRYLTACDLGGASEFSGWCMRTASQH